MSSSRDILAQVQAERAYKKSVQEMMDEKMCRPGYRWLGEPLNRCIPAAVPSNSGDTPDTPTTPAPEPEVETPSADEAIAAEASRRQQSKGKK